MSSNLRLGRFVLVQIMTVLVFDYCADSIKAMFALAPHSSASRLVDILFLTAGLHLMFAVLRQVKQGGHPWLRR